VKIAILALLDIHSPTCCCLRIKRSLFW